MEQPERIGKYEIEEFLGGGMSHVFRARDTVIGRTVAIKVLTADAASDPESKARFLREAQMAGNIAHENIMSVYDFGEEEGRPFMVMEFLRGEDLRSSIKKGHLGDRTARLRLALQVARALEYIHQQGIIHRDIKPENIHINANGTAKLVDFGIAKREDLSLTKPGFTAGTPYYMAPEQVIGKDVTPLADVYAFGILLFELITGSRPIAGDTTEQIFYKTLNEPVDLSPLQQAGCPETISGLIARCIAKNAADRPQNMSIVRCGIEQELEPDRPPVPAEKAARGYGRVIAVAVAVLAGAALLFFALLNKKDLAMPPEAGPELSATISTPTGEMVLVKAGTLPVFYIDKTEVTNEAYARFCAERNRPWPPGFPQDHLNYPVVNITIIDAKEFAEWAGKRLPGKSEWEAAARGTDGRTYPWGSTHDSSRANVADNSRLNSRALMPVDSFAEGASPYQALQMAGNAWEFVYEPITPSVEAVRRFANLISPPPAADEPWYMIHGGSFKFPLIQNPALEWSAVPARFLAPDIGFRCAKTPDR